MYYLTELFGEGTALSPLQMSVRGVVTFIVALILIRISGRRSFGMKMPFDNVILILLGAILSRAVVGASPYVATVCASLAIVMMHRLFAKIGLYSPLFGLLVKGKSIALYNEGQLLRGNMAACDISEKDLLELVRLKSGHDSFEKVRKICMERNGEVSIILLSKSQP